MNTTLLKKYWKPLAGVAGLAVMIAWSGGSCSRKVHGGSVEYEPGFALPAGAPTATAEKTSVTSRVDVVGTATSEEQIHLSSRISAYVKEIFVSAGNAVTNGQVLATLDDREMIEQLAAAQAQLKQAETEYQRTRQLFEKTATTEQALTAAESAFNAAKAQVDQIHVMLTYCRIVSPIHGVVTDRRIEAGDLANPGQVLMTVYDPVNMRLEAPVPMRLLERLQLGQDVDVQLDRPASVFQGRVSEIVGEIDPLSRTQKVKVHIDDANRSILPGTFGRLWVADTPHDGVLVPRSAVYAVGQLELVQVVQNGRVIRRLVKTGAVFGDRVEILSGLEGGETILAQPVKEV